MLIDKFLELNEVLIHLVVVVGGARGVMVIVAGNGHGNMSSNPG